MFISFYDHGPGFGFRIQHLPCLVFFVYPVVIPTVTHNMNMATNVICPFFVWLPLPDL